MSSDCVSTSSISITPATTGCHMLKIEGYSQTKRIPTGSYAKSAEFEAAGQTWFISYYPNGHSSASADQISLFINLARSQDNDTMYANMKFSLVPHDGKPAPVTPYCRRFTTNSKQLVAANGYGYASFIKREVLENSEYLVDDCFAVRFDIDAVKVSAAADLSVKAQDLKRLRWPCSCEDDLCKRFHPGRTVDPALSSIDDSLKASSKSTDSLKTSSAAPTPAVPPRHRGLKAAWFRLVGFGKV